MKQFFLKYIINYDTATMMRLLLILLRNKKRTNIIYIWLYTNCHFLNQYKIFNDNDDLIETTSDKVLWKASKEATNIILKLNSGQKPSELIDT